MITTIKKSLLLSTAFVALLSMMLLSTQVFAHSYHYEVQVSNALKFNDDKQLEALRLSFIYDGEVSAVMLQDEKDLDKLGKSLIKDLEKLAYFTQAKIDGKVLEFKEASDIKLESTKEQGEDKETYDALKLNFTLALKKPAALNKDSNIGFFHEDPTEAAILYYDNAKSITVSDSLKDNCKASVKEKGDFKEGEFPQVVSVDCKA